MEEKNRKQFQWNVIPTESTGFAGNQIGPALPGKSIGFNSCVIGAEKVTQHRCLGKDKRLF